MEPITIQQEFDPTKDLPAWARRVPVVVRFAEADLSFRIACWTKTARTSKREQKRLAGVAYRVLDYRSDLLDVTKPESE